MVPSRKVLRYHENLESEEEEGFFQSGWVLEDWTEELAEEDELENDDEDDPVEVKAVIRAHHRFVNNFVKEEKYSHTSLGVKRVKKSKSKKVRFEKEIWKMDCSMIGTGKPCVEQAKKVKFSKVAYK